MSKPFYLTTAIDYVNGAPHLGHAYEKILADIIARARRSMGEEVFFLTGLDEHGQKVQQAAQKDGLDPQIYCDQLAVQWQAFIQTLGITNNDFVRTTQSRHQEVVQAVLRKLLDQNDLYKAPYEGWYSARQETFLTDKDRLPDGAWPAIYGDVIRLVEENWYFRMSQHQAWLVEYIESHPDFVQPDYRRNEILGFLRAEKLEDLCISRPRARLSWGIPIPFDPEYVNYVWFDALTNYFSIPVALGDAGAREVLGRYYSPAASAPTPSAPTLWPADIHIIGKDIVKFHAVYWPIMLKALGAPLPKQVLVHGWWQKDGEKMSKSTGNVVDPIAVIQEWGIDAFRFYVVRELDIGPDGNWTDSGFSQRYHAELANGLGNLLNRSLSMLRRYRDGVVPTLSNELAGITENTVRETEALLRANRLQSALVSIWNLITHANQYIDRTAPFKLAKDPTQAARLDEVLYNLIEVCRVLGVLLWPFLPTTSERIHSQLQLPSSLAPQHWAHAAWGGLKPGHRVGEPSPLFPRRDQPK